MAEVTSTSQSNIPKTDNKSCCTMLYLTKAQYDNPAAELLYNGSDWQKYGKSANELLQLGEQYHNQPDAFEAALLGAEM